MPRRADTLFDLAKELRDSGTGVVSGFHAPMDKECFDILLRGKGPIVWCPARSIETMRLKSAYKKAVDEGRLLILSPFPAKQSRQSAPRAESRNRLVAALAERVFVAYADPGGKTEQLCRLDITTRMDMLRLTEYPESRSPLARLGWSPSRESLLAELVHRLASAVSQ